MPQDCCGLSEDRTLEGTRHLQQGHTASAKPSELKQNGGSWGAETHHPSLPDAQGPPETESMRDSCSLVVFRTAFIPSKKVAGKTLIPKVHLQSWGQNVTKSKSTGRDGEIQPKKALQHKSQTPAAFQQERGRPVSALSLPAPISW